MDRFHWLFSWLPPLHVAPRLALWTTLSLAYSLAVMLALNHLQVPPWPAGAEIGASLSLALGILLVFRNNAAYERWWEARKLWGQLINDERNLASKARAHAALDADEQRELARLLIGFCHALRLHLRGPCTVQQVPGFEREQTDFPHAPGYMAGHIHQLINHWNRAGRLKESVWILDVHARSLLDICGACERIRNTPVASSYRSLLRGAIAVYVVAAPWPVSLEMGWWGMLVLAVAFGFMLGIELTAEDVEEPFGTDDDDLPLETYCATIENYVRAELGGRGTVDAIPPVN